MLSRVHPVVEGENSRGRKTTWHRVFAFGSGRISWCAIWVHVESPALSSLDGRKTKGFWKPQQTVASQQMQPGMQKAGTILSMYGMFAYTFVMHKSSYRNLQSWIDRQEYSSQCALKKVEGAWKQTKRQRQSPIQSFLPQNCPCKCEPAPELTVVPAAFVWDFTLGKSY